MADTSTVGPGTVLADRYELTAIIGRGGFGTVWRARQLNMDRDVAIKVLPPQFQNLQDVVERFKREARLASRLRHPNTITLHDYGQHDNLLYIVMELLTGEDLADLLKREGRLQPDRIMHITRQVLKSLAEAHEQNIVHRDLKPENIYLSVVGDDRDHVKVVDFGIAKLLQPTAGDSQDASGRRLTMTGSTVGTPTYMSPEQAAGEDVNGQTDLYALGVIMYESANGRPPFHNKDPVKVMRAQIFDPVPPMRDPHLRGSLLDRVIQKALHKEKAHRFQSAHEMLLALAGEPVAKPVIQGIAFHSLQDSQPEEEGLAEETGPMAEEFQEDRPQTLSFVKSVNQAREAEDSIPFGAVDAHADTVAPRARSTVRSAGAATASTPPGALSGDDAVDPSATSSIISVIPDSEPADSGVILLTKRKTPEQSVAQGEPPEEEPAGSGFADVAAPSAEAAEPWSSSEIVPGSPPPQTGRISSRDADIYKSWEWEPGVELDHTAPQSMPKKDGVGMWIVLLLLVAGAIAAFAIL